MDRLTRYILRQLFVATTFVTLVMTCIIWLAISLRAVEGIINNGFTLKNFIALTALQMPNFLVSILPFALFISVLFVYNRLNTDRELVVLRAAGMSPLKMAGPAILLGILLTLVSYLLGIVAAPASYKQFRVLQFDLRYSLSRVLIREGEFNTFSGNITVYIRERSGGSELRGLLVQDNSDPAKPATYIAERGAMVQSPTGARVIMFDGNRQELDKKTGKVQILYFDRYNFDLGLVTQKPNVRYREPRERSVSELLTLKSEDLGNPNDFGKFRVEAHQRLASPLNSLAFALIAVAALLLGGYSRRTQYVRVIIASVLFAGLWLTNLTLINLIAKNLELIPAIYVATVLPIVAAFAVLVVNPRRLPNIRRRGAVAEPANVQARM